MFWNKKKQTPLTAIRLTVHARMGESRANCYRDAQALADRTGCPVLFDSPGYPVVEFFPNREPIFWDEKEN
jgi:hypothetical protein